MKARNNNITVLVVEPGCDPVVREIKNELKAMQAIVGGWLESVPVSQRVVLYCNEEGWLIGLKPTISFCGRIIAGPCFLGRHDKEGEMVPLMESDVDEFFELAVVIG